MNFLINSSPSRLDMPNLSSSHTRPHHQHNNEARHHWFLKRKNKFFPQKFQNSKKAYLRKFKSILVKMESSSVADAYVKWDIFGVEVLDHRSRGLLHQLLSNAQATMAPFDSLQMHSNELGIAKLIKNKCLTNEVMWPCGIVLSSLSSSLNFETKFQK